MVPSGEAIELVCEWCRMTEVKPCLTNDEHLTLWAKLERAKQRFLFPLKSLHLPPFASDVRLNMPLRFQFLADCIDEQGQAIPAITGHQNGLISIRLMEADSVLREKTRVDLREPHRSLIGHFRHEYGHYFDLATWSHRDQAESIRLFGDPLSIDYEAAKSQYYSVGPGPAWQNHFVSPYASMHPWEDFAETVSVYLDMHTIWSNAKWFGWLDRSREVETVEVLADETLRIACFISECNLDMGLPVLLPDVINSEVMAKLAYVHGLAQSGMHFDTEKGFTNLQSLSSMAS